ncbi:type II toxin-antitoxin system PemK/MazF family toxin [Symbioplanes lichenis]|uniref:type II toxin-antitoxin system PemK/MazF family toxin n=1 Tax=Symbioplanes lichenis TaxID=1629072 RepID=UPI0027392D24|nr:type II toxin-antitoxin system PemK/MazF family toxin [Actinoplanes lichenis]
MTDETVRVHPWEVWWAQLSPQVGREQAGERPVIVVGSMVACALPNEMALLVPCTTTGRGLAFQPPVTLAGRPGYAMCEQIKALSVRRLVRRHRQGLLDTEERPAVRRALRQMLV